MLELPLTATESLSIVPQPGRTIVFSGSTHSKTVIAGGFYGELDFEAMCDHVVGSRWRFLKGTMNDKMHDASSLCMSSCRPCPLDRKLM